MNPGLVVKLRPAGPWRSGPDSGARNRVDPIYHSDSIYAAVTAALSTLGRRDEWLDATARNPQGPAVRFSSCFPFLGELAFIVPPRSIWPPLAGVSVSAAKVRWKSARFIPLPLVAALLGWYLVDVFRTSPQGALAALDLNTYNLMFITVGLLLHWRPKRFMRAVADCVPATGGVLIQFPFYAVIFGMIVGTGVAEALAKLFASISTHNTYPLLVAVYSAVLGVFIPSGGSKWIVEAPYVLQAANLHQVHLGWVVQIYNASEALPNLVNPFWMLPLLGILKLKARDIVGYGMLQLAVHVPVVFFLCWLFARTIPYVPPVK